MSEHHKGKRPAKSRIIITEDRDSSEEEIPLLKKEPKESQIQVKEGHMTSTENVVKVKPRSTVDSSQLLLNKLANIENMLKRIEAARIGELDTLKTEICERVAECVKKQLKIEFKRSAAKWQKDSEYEPPDALTFAAGKSSTAQQKKQDDVQEHSDIATSTSHAESTSKAEQETVSKEMYNTLLRSYEKLRKNYQKVKENLLEINDGIGDKNFSQTSTRSLYLLTILLLSSAVYSLTPLVVFSVH